MSHREDNKRIAKNTIYLYVRSLITLIISLYTSRVILEVLGFADYGIYNLVASVVVMFNMLSSTFVASTQRFLNFYLGQNDEKKVTKVFSAAVNIHAMLAVFIFILLETVGVWLVNTKLNIPPDRLFAAKIVYQCSVFTFIINLFTIPYNALIIAKEKMRTFAFVSIYESIMKLVIVFTLQIFVYDKLIMYGLLQVIVPCSILLFYRLNCKRNVRECHYIKVDDRKLYREMLSISGWNFLGSSATIATVSGMSIIINLFTNVVVNSAKGIAAQVEHIVKQLIDNFMTSIRPQITKSYAAGDYSYMYKLISRGSRFSLYLMTALCFPIIINADFILKLWLGAVPEYTSNFIIWSLVYLLVIPFSNILDNVLMATGKIKQSQILLSILQLCNIPFSCLILYMGCAPYYIYASFISISYISLVVRIHFSGKYAGFSVSDYFLNTFCKPVAIIMASFLISCMASKLLDNGINDMNDFVKCIINIVITELVLISLCLRFGTEKVERDFLLVTIKSKLKL